MRSACNSNVAQICMQRTCQVRANRHLHGQGAIPRLALPQSVPGEAQSSHALHVRPRLLGEQVAGRLPAVGGADAEDAFLAAQVRHPLPIAAQVAVAGMAQAAGVGVHHAQDGQPAIDLPDDAAGHRLGVAVEANVGGTRVAPSPAGNVASTTASLASRRPSSTQPVSSSPRARRGGRRTPRTAFGRPRPSAGPARGDRSGGEPAGAGAGPGRAGGCGRSSDRCNSPSRSLARPISPCNMIRSTANPCRAGSRSLARTATAASRTTGPGEENRRGPEVGRPSAVPPPLPPIS